MLKSKKIKINHKLIPLIFNDPLTTGARPAKALNKVDLPPPLGPTTATFFPLVMEKVTSSSAWVFPI